LGFLGADIVVVAVERRFVASLQSGSDRLPREAIVSPARVRERLGETDGAQGAERSSTGEWGQLILSRLIRCHQFRLTERQAFS